MLSRFVALSVSLTRKGSLLQFCMYRNSLWHCGSYVPYTKRATMHDIIDTPLFADWVATHVPNHFKRSTLDRMSNAKKSLEAEGNAHGVAKL